MSTAAIGLQNINFPWEPRSSPIRVGKDILELLSSSMYVDPMAIYREYIQNAADSIDEARKTGILTPHTAAKVELRIDPQGRRVTIRDNGTGIPSSEFEARLTAFGASSKRGSQARGFRGVGRLAGIGYCQELIFRSRTIEESKVNEIRWDCRKIKEHLRSQRNEDDLAHLVNEATFIRTTGGTREPRHFFEVELSGIVRHKNDSLLNSAAVADYLSQVAPIPFSPAFRYAEDITSFLAPHVSLGDLPIVIDGLSEPIFRPHQNCIEISAGACESFSDLEFVSVPNLEGGLAGVGWVLHHEYRGAIPGRAGIKGLRLRNGNIQVGDERLLEELFTEPRFNAWSVGEIHVVDPRIMPNGRRDHYEQNVHFHNLLNHLTPHAREISRRCRTNSIVRNRLREFDRLSAELTEQFSIIKQGTLGLMRQRSLHGKIRAGLARMDTIAVHPGFTELARSAQRRKIRALRRKHERMLGVRKKAKKLTNMPARKHAAYQRIFDLIYECSTNPSLARMLIQRILTRL